MDPTGKKADAPESTSDQTTPNRLASAPSAGRVEADDANAPSKTQVTGPTTGVENQSSTTLGVAAEASASLPHSLAGDGQQKAHKVAELRLAVRRAAAEAKDTTKGGIKVVGEVIEGELTAQQELKPHDPERSVSVDSQPSQPILEQRVSIAVLPFSAKDDEMMLQLLAEKDLKMEYKSIARAMKPMRHKEEVKERLLELMNVPKDKVSTELKGATEDALEPITSSLSNEPRHEQSPIATPQPLETTLFSPPVPQTEEEDFLAASPKRPRSPSPPRAFTASPDFAPPAQRSRLSSPSSNQPLINKPERSFSLPTDSSTHGLLSMSMSSPIRRRSFGGGDAREGVQEEVVEIAVKGAANEARKRGMSFKGVGNETDGSGEGGSGDGRETEETSGEGSSTTLPTSTAAPWINITASQTHHPPPPPPLALPAPFFALSLPPLFPPIITRPSLGPTPTPQEAYDALWKLGNE